MKLNAVRIFALINVLIVGYLFHELYQLRHPESEKQPQSQSATSAPEPDLDQAFADATNEEASLQERITALSALSLTSLSQEQASQIAETIFKPSPNTSILSTLELRNQGARLLLNAPASQEQLIKSLSAIAQDPSEALPIRNQSLILLYQLTSKNDSIAAGTKELFAQTREELFSDRSTSLAATVIEGDAFLFERNSELVSAEELSERTLRGLRDLRSSEPVQLAALQVATKNRITSAREDAEAIAKDNPSQSLTLAALNAAATLGSSDEFFESLSYPDSKLELVRLQALRSK
ncbi:hypothetical protein [Cerasicoccus maritimus]|uniref:hypothetical protein n=1 Tax=Cerasicoccus maritimus TaxID=490089 RepID=UPI002852B982|nr:hypothetical protein [Cerasicoccus maritimus]